MNRPATTRFGAIAGAFFYLQATSLYNNVRRRLLRLKQPKYLLGAVAGAAYLYAFVFRHWLHSNAGPAQVAQALPQSLIHDLPALAGIALLLVLWLDWLFAGEDVALGFSETEVAFLFPAPLTRTALIQYNLLRSQLAIFLSAFILGLLFRRGGALTGHPLQYATGWWLLLSIGRLHFLAAAFTRERLRQAGLHTWLRRLLVLLAGIALVAATVHALGDGLTLPAISGRNDIGKLHPWLRGIVDQAPLAWVLMPMQWVAAPIFATDTASFLRSLIPAFGLLVLHYLWAVRAQVSFEEGSIAHARKQALRQAARQDGRLRERGPRKPQPAPFTLATRGFPALAFLWKGLLALGPMYRLRHWLLACLLAFLGVQWAAAQPWGKPVLMAIGSGMLMLAGWGLLFGPMFMQRAIQRLLLYLDILKATPLGGRQIALGELLTPVTLMSFAMWWLLWTGTLCFALAGGGRAGIAPATILGAALAVAVLVPFLSGLMLCVPFAGTLYFPAWMAPAAGGGRGVEVMGQRMIFMAVYLLALVVALLPAALLAGGGFLLANWLVGLAAGMLLATLCAGASLALEVYWVLGLLGRRIERFDVSQELR